MTPKRASSDDGSAGADPADGLYELPPEAFVEARNRLAAELRAGGDKEHAASVKELRRPSRLAWALNQVARADPSIVDDVLGTAAEVGRRQGELLAGGDRDDLRRARDRHREVLDRFAGQVAARAGADLRPGAVAALEGAAADPELAALLRAGRLTKEPDRPAGFGFGDVEIKPATKSRTTSTQREDRQRTRELAQAKRELDRADRNLATAIERAERAEARVNDAVAEAEAARAAADRACEERDAAASALEQRSSPT